MKNILFYCLVLYYIILNYFLSGEVTRFSLLYFLITIPNVAFVIIFSYYLVKSYSKATLTLALFFVIAFIISLLRLDFSTIITTVLLVFTMIVTLNSKVEIKISYINAFFLLCIFGSIISYHIGINEYGYIPNMSSMAQIVWGGAGPRISLFPLIPESAFFSLFVILGNYYYNPSRYRFLFYLLGGYFLLLSGSRTALSILVFFIVFEIITKYIPFRYRTFYILLNALFAVAFLMLINLKSLQVYLSKSDNPLLKAIILRDQTSVITESSDIHDVSTRLWIWEQHFKIFATKPLIGVGTYNFGDYIPVKTKPYHFTSGSESFLTAWLARIGICVLLLLVFFYYIQKRALHEKNKFSYYMSFYLFLVIISYGSFVVPYNFMFLLILVSLSSVTAPVTSNVKRRSLVLSE